MKQILYDTRSLFLYYKSSKLRFFASYELLKGIEGGGGHNWKNKLGLSCAKLRGTETRAMPN